MAYPRENLAPGERIVLHRHPHWKCLLGPFLLFILATAIAGLLAGLVNASSLTGTGALIAYVAVAVLWAAATIWFFLRPLISWKTTHFVLTDRRVIFRHGILTRSGIDIPIRRINTVEFRHGPIDRLLRTGTLLIESASDEPLAFDDIPQVERVHALLYHEVLEVTDDPDPDDERFDDDTRMGGADVGATHGTDAGHGRWGRRR
ncbi:PH domain-containing protein [Gordonia sp. L191]|uniref:PH domain-containing protein n=1 Tax=Gordonia TaxID=2053 RepID=UPI001AD7C6D9|nr:MULTISPECIES: PH domain-containing protein [Gordonia]QTI71252.1 PH domain-containing protein [Gordonia polyisoprenivorans]WHU45321.1 PH domain-containing protein [Gordonia sp. L191]